MEICCEGSCGKGAKSSLIERDERFLLRQRKLRMS